MNDQRLGRFRSRMIIQCLCLAAILLTGFGCATGPNDSSEQSAPDDLSAGDPVVPSDSGDEAKSAGQSGAESKPQEDEFLDDLNKQSGKDSQQQSQQTPAEEPPLELPPEDPPAPVAETLPPLEESPPPQSAESPPPQLTESPPSQSAESPPAPLAESPPPTESVPVPSGGQKTVDITNLNYKANESGGTVVIEGTGPLTYTTRSNPELKQFIVEVSNSRLPARLKRSLNTKDFNGAIGAIDAYQTSGSKVSRFVIQLREGSPEPFVQVEGHMLLVVSSNSNAAGVAPTAGNMTQQEGAATPQGVESGSGDQVVSADPIADGDLNINLNDSRILTSQALSEFLAGSTKFYGKRISVEFNRTDLRQAIRFFMEETGVNMIIDKEVAGETTMKLRQVPWDQAFITMLRMSDLSYQRQGSILRIATVKKLKEEEKDTRDLLEAQKQTQPILVRNFFVNFALVSDVAKSIKEMLKEGGKESTTTKIVEDPKNGKLIVQDTASNLDLIEKLVRNLDMPIKQVLIEAKIVEASEKFARTMGVNWKFSDGGQAIGNQQLVPEMTVGQSPSGSDLNFGFKYGPWPLLGDLAASLSLAEIDNTIKIISSPRIMTLTGSPATVNVTDVLQFLSSSQSALTANAPVVNSYKDVSIPTILNVTPNVTPDNFVMMKVNVSRAVASVNAGGGSSQSTRTVETNILIRDGQTATIGGLYQTDALDSVNGVPVLKDIPFLGALFRSKQESKTKTELLIFLTPRVITQDLPATQAKEGVSL